MFKRKLDGAVDESSANNISINPTRLYISCEKSGGLHLVESGLTAVGRQANWQVGRQNSGEVRNF